MLFRSLDIFTITWRNLIIGMRDEYLAINDFKTGRGYLLLRNNPI